MEVKKIALDSTRVENCVFTTTSIHLIDVQKAI
jgi:hypothetical protein